MQNSTYSEELLKSGYCYSSKSSYYDVYCSGINVCCCSSDSYNYYPYCCSCGLATGYIILIVGVCISVICGIVAAIIICKRRRRRLMQQMAYARMAPNYANQPGYPVNQNPPTFVYRANNNQQSNQIPPNYQPPSNYQARNPQSENNILGREKEREYAYSNDLTTEKDKY